MYDNVRLNQFRTTRVEEGQHNPQAGRRTWSKEDRTPLIADLIAGKLDVREAAAQLPDDTDNQGRVEDGSQMAERRDGDIYDAEEEQAVAEEVRI